MIWQSGLDIFILVLFFVHCVNLSLFVFFRPYRQYCIYIRLSLVNNNNNNIEE